MPRNDLLVWMDLEMTSIHDATKDQIIEIAVVLTDADLRVVAEGPDIVIHADQEQFDHIEPHVRALHTESGMLEASIASTRTLTEAEDEVLAFLQEHVAEKTAPLCGNSIHADRHFLKIQMPRVDQHLFYRCIDVSTLKELAKRWIPDVYAEAERRKVHKVHRAKDDILKSIDELRWYRESIFRQ